MKEGMKGIDSGPKKPHNPVNIAVFVFVAGKESPTKIWIIKHKAKMIVDRERE